MFSGIKNKIKDSLISDELDKKEKILIEKYNKLEKELEQEYEIRLKVQVETLEERFIEETNQKLLVVCKEYQRFFNDKIDQIEKVLAQVNFQAEQFNIFIQIQFEQMQKRVDDCMKQEQAQKIRKEALTELKKAYEKDPKDSFFKKVFTSKGDIQKNLDSFDQLLKEITRQQVDSVLKIKQKISVDSFFLLECNILKEIRKLYIDDSNMESIKNNYIKTFECCVCLNKYKVEYVWSSCGHTNTCSGCSSSLKACPICRKPGKLIHLYI